MPMNRKLDLRSERAYWVVRNGIDDASPQLPGSLDCEVAIVGAGISGALVARELMRHGVRDLVILDRRDRALGSTSASTALLQYEIDVPLIELDRRIGMEKAARAYLACAEAVDIAESIATETATDVGFRRRNSLYLAARKDDMRQFESELTARRGIGLPVRILDRDALRTQFGMDRPGALWSAQAAELDPVRFTRALLDGANALGARCYSNTVVKSIASSADGVTLTCDDSQKGHRVGAVVGPEANADRIAQLAQAKAKRAAAKTRSTKARPRPRGKQYPVVRARAVVICGGYEALSMLPRRYATLHSTYALVTEPAADPSIAAARPLVWEAARPYLYSRATPDGRTLIGGEDLPYRSAKARDAQLSRKVAALMKKGRRLLGPLPPPAYAWAGTFGESPDSLPLIGVVPGWHSRVQVAMCLGGNGIIYAVQAARMIASALGGARHDLHNVFGFERLHR